MKEGYIVWNNSNYGAEFFGVYKNLQTAERKLRQVVRGRFGYCPRDISGIIDMPEMDSEDSYQVSYFEQYEKGVM